MVPTFFVEWIDFWTAHRDDLGLHTHTHAIKWVTIREGYFNLMLFDWNETP